MGVCQSIILLVIGIAMVPVSFRVVAILADWLEPKGPFKGRSL